MSCFACGSQNNCFQLFCDHWVCKVCILINPIETCGVCNQHMFTGSIHRRSTLYVSLGTSVNDLLESTDMTFRSYFLSRKYIVYLAEELVGLRKTECFDIANAVSSILEEMHANPLILYWPHDMSSLRAWYDRLREHMLWRSVRFQIPLV